MTPVTPTQRRALSLPTCCEGRSRIKLLGLLTVLGTLMVASATHAGEGPMVKMMLPARVAIQLAESVAPGVPTTLLITATALDRLDAGQVIVWVPQIGSRPADSLNLWQGTLDTSSPLALKVPIPALSPGDYTFRASLMFRYAGRGIPGAVSQNLYVTVSDSDVQSSVVSFQRIKMEELMKRLRDMGIDPSDHDEIRTRAPELWEEIMNLLTIRGIETVIPNSSGAKVPPRRDSIGVWWEGVKEGYARPGAVTDSVPKKPADSSRTQQGDDVAAMSAGDGWLKWRGDGLTRGVCATCREQRTLHEGRFDAESDPGDLRGRGPEAGE